jgi:hypothetical protein
MACPRPIHECMHASYHTAVVGVQRRAIWQESHCGNMRQMHSKKPTVRALGRPPLGLAACDVTESTQPSRYSGERVLTFALTCIVATSQACTWSSGPTCSHALLAAASAATRRPHVLASRRCCRQTAARARFSTPALRQSSRTCSFSPQHCGRAATCARFHPSAAAEQPHVLVFTPAL